MRHCNLIVRLAQGPPKAPGVDGQGLPRLDRVEVKIAEEFQGRMLGFVSGEYDYLIRGAVGGTAGYGEFLRRKLYKVPGLRHSRSTFVLRMLKNAHSPQP